MNRCGSRGNSARLPSTGAGTREARTNQLSEHEVARILRALRRSDEAVSRADWQSRHDWSRRKWAEWGLTESEGEELAQASEKGAPLPEELLDRVAATKRTRGRRHGPKPDLMIVNENRAALLAVRKFGQVLARLDKDVSSGLSEERKIRTYIGPLAKLRVEVYLLGDWLFARFQEEASARAREDALRWSIPPPSNKEQRDSAAERCGKALKAAGRAQTLITDFARYLAERRRRRRKGLSDLRSSEWAALWFFYGRELERKGAPSRIQPDADLDAALNEIARLKKTVCDAKMPPVPRVSDLE